MKRSSVFSALVFVAACGGSPAPVATTPSAADEASNEGAQLELGRAEARFVEFSQGHIDCAEQPDLEHFIQCLQDQVRLLSSSAMESVEAYERVLTRSEEPRWAVASLSGQARTFARMTEMLNEVEVPELYPAALLEEDARLSEDARRAVQVQVEATIREALETQAAPIGCTAVVYDVMALRVAQSQQVESEYAQEAMFRTAPLSDEQIAACVEQGRVSDESLEEYTPGELNLQR